MADSYELSSSGERLLTSAGESWDRAQQARRALAKYGLTFLDSKGNPKPRPEVGIERDSQVRFARLVRELDLEDGPLPDPRVPRPRSYQQPHAHRPVAHPASRRP